MKRGKNTCLSIIGTILSSASPVVCFANKWRRKNILVSPVVEERVLDTLKFNIESIIAQAMQVLSPNVGLYSDHFGSVKPIGRCKSVLVITTSLGTKIKCLGWPLWSTALTFVIGKYLSWSAMDWPILNERLISIGSDTYFTNDGSTYNLLPKLNRPNKSLDECIIASSPPICILDECSQITLEDDTIFIGHEWGDYAFSLLARGIIDVVIDYNISRRTLLATVPILRGVGCTITDWKGRKTCSSNRIIASNNEGISSELRAMLTFYSD